MKIEEKKIAVFLDVMACTVIEDHRYFGELLGIMYQTAWCHFPENSNVNSHCHENLKCSIALLRATAEGKE
jgi:hypothetical protein